MRLQQLDNRTGSFKNSDISGNPRCNEIAHALGKYNVKGILIHFEGRGGKLQNCFHGEQVISYYSRPFFKGGQVKGSKILDSLVAFCDTGRKYKASDTILRR